MNAKDILSDQVIVVKRGRSNSFGWEPCWNSYFDFYLDKRYFGKPLLELGDVTFHLYLRKNLNDKNPNWKMPTIRQIRNKFGTSNDKIYVMLSRLEKAYLLTKESGVKAGTPNERNAYILSDPIPTLSEFLQVAAEGLFGLPLLTGYDPCSENRNTPDLRVPETGTPDVPESGIRHVPETGTDQQTSNPKQTLKNGIDPAFEELKLSVGEQTLDRFLGGAKLLALEEGIAIIGTSRSYAKDFIENQLSNKLKSALKANVIKCVVLTE